MDFAPISTAFATSADAHGFPPFNSLSFCATSSARQRVTAGYGRRPPPPFSFVFVETPGFFFALLRFLMPFTFAVGGTGAFEFSSVKVLSKTQAAFYDALKAV